MTRSVDFLIKLSFDQVPWDLERRRFAKRQAISLEVIERLRGMLSRSSLPKTGYDLHDIISCCTLFSLESHGKAGLRIKSEIPELSYTGNFYASNIS